MAAFVVVAIKAPIILSAYQELWGDWKVTRSICVCNSWRYRISFKLRLATNLKVHGLSKSRLKQYL